MDPKSKFTDKELRKIFEKLKETTCGTENITKAFETENGKLSSDQQDTDDGHIAAVCCGGLSILD